MDNQQLVKQILDRISAVVKEAIREVAPQFTEKKADRNGINEDYLSAEQAATFLKIQLNTIYSKVEKGELPHYRSGKRKLIFSKRELEQYILRRRGISAEDASNAADQFLLKHK